MGRYTELESFVRVVEAGSFVEAARQLGISPPVVTRRVNELEARLQVRLLQRTTRRLSVTEAGRAFHPRAMAALESLQRAEASVGDADRSLRGLLRVSSPTSFGVLLLAPLLCAFRQAHPGITLELLLNDRRVHPVAEGFDLVLDDSGDPPPGMVVKPVATARRLLCASPDYLAQRGDPRQPQDLSSHDCIHYQYLESGNTWVLHNGKRRARVRVAPAFSTDSGSVMLSAAMHGSGIALLPSFLAIEALRAEKLRIVLPGWHAADLKLCALYPHRAYLPARARVLIDLMTDRFATDPPSWETSSGAEH
jgi:DNA-binding transcriptional LysR family regulator